MSVQSMIQGVRPALRRAKPILLAVGLFCVLAPLKGDAAQANCCNAAASLTANLFPGGRGDEDFFTRLGGPPNVMIVLDTSGSMLDFPTDPVWPSLSNNAGTCALPEYADAAAAQATSAGDNTFETAINFAGGTIDTPSYVTPGCSGTAGACLFKKDAYYRYAPGAMPTTDWNTVTYATERTSGGGTGGACYNISGSTAISNCTTCLTTKGYYLYKDNNGAQRAAFKGSFLNVYPPKFIIARKVLRDLLSIDPLNPSTVDGVRFGLTVFSGSNSQTLTKPLLPTCANSIGSGAAANFISARTSIIQSVDSIAFGTTTPLAETLFKVAQYFSDGTSSTANSAWHTWFPSSWDSNFAPTAGGSNSWCWSCQQSSVIVITDGVPYNDNTIPNSSIKVDHENLVCYSSYTPPSPLPTITSSGQTATTCGTANGVADFTRWKSTGSGATFKPALVGGDKKLQVDCATTDCGLDDDGSGKLNQLHKVAAFLRWNDLHPDTDSAGNSLASTVGTDTAGNSWAGSQYVSTYTIGINLPAGSVGTKLLEKTAQLGDGQFENASNADELSNAIAAAVSSVVTRATTFSASNTNALQAATAAQLFTARFRPTDRVDYEGHLYRFTLFNELALGCDTKKSNAAQDLVQCGVDGTGAPKMVNPNLDGTVDASNHATCSGFYIVDKNCDPVIEDSTTGAFVKGDFSSGALNTRVDGTGKAVPAVPFWDAGSVLSTPGTTGYRSADSSASNGRTIYTVVDNDSTAGDGKFTRLDTLVPFDDAHVDTLLPYLGLDQTWCTKLYNRLGFTVPSTWAASDYTNCAKQVIWFTRGWDVLDADDDGCAGPGGLGAGAVQTPKACTADTDCSPSTAGVCASGACTCAAGVKGEQRDAANGGHWKLGDIFHSSPQAVDPPYNEAMCDMATSQTQCVSTIHSPASLIRETQTKIAVDATTGDDAYEQYRKAQAGRKRIVLAGANDGMLHAFDAGDPDTTQPADPFGSRPYTYGTGEELWAFIPPDLLPKLKYALDTHQYFVDGNVMVRDIWYDTNGDHIKTSDEFHTVAIVSERTGGTQFFALDVTSPTAPRFLWTFPQLCTQAQTLVGQSWSDFAPRPPPVGPVKIKLASGTDPAGRNFEERWITMLNGGFDSTGARGRGVFMVDAWTGDEIWRFTDAEFQAQMGSTNKGSMFPVAAAPGLLDVGDVSQPTLDSDGYFDTATWGDLGGQLWVARFKDPDKSKWTGARAFEALRSDSAQNMSMTSGSSRQVRNEFYKMTSNAWDYDNTVLRSYLGSGNRDRVLTVGQVCGPTNDIACAQAGCGTVQVTNTTSVSSSSSTTSTFSTSSGVARQVLPTSSGWSAATCTGVSASITQHLASCNSTNPTDVTASMTCDANGVCTRTTIDRTRDLNTKTWTTLTSHNRFYGVGVLSSTRNFNAPTEAVTYDSGRYTDVPFNSTTCPSNACTLVDVTQAQVDSAGAVTCGGGVSKCSAGAADPGWFYEYGRKCPFGNDAACTGDSALPWTDEKTASGATVIAHCVDWNTLRPMGAAVGSGAAPCSYGSGSPRNFTYLADMLTGVPNSSFCGFQASATSSIYRAQSRISVAPPLDPTTVVTVTESGGSKQTALQIEPGSTSSKDLSAMHDLTRPIYWLEVPRDLHQCRHVSSSSCP